MEKYVKIINIIDKSGSMNSMIDVAINGFNEFLQEQKSVEGNVLVTTVLFSDKYKVLYENINIKDCKFFNKENYSPGGMTALYDAIGTTIENEIEILGSLPLEQRPEKTLCIILTDGFENKSSKFNKEQIKNMITEMKKDFNWEFIFLAANEDASLTAETMGISKGNSYSFTNSSSGLEDAYKGISYATMSYRTKSSIDMSNLMDDYKKL